jgi:hypothetical protein
MSEYLKLYLNSKIKHIVKFYMAFAIIYLIFDVAFVSIIAFFHFLLDHDMSIVENWVYRNSWEILSLSKIISFAITMKVVNVKIYRENPFLEFLKKGFINPNHYIFVVIIFLATFINALGDVKIQMAHTKYSTFHAISFLGNFIFYFTDYILLFYLKSLYPIYRNWENYFFIIFTSLSFFIFSLITIPYSKELSIFLLLHFLSLILFTLPRAANWSIGLAYILLLICPLATFIGVDPIWSSDFSLFKLSNPLPFSYIIAIWGLTFGYNYYMRGKRLID